MDELKQLAEIVKDLPTMGMVILGAYFFYKIFIVGSIFTIVRFVIRKLSNTVNLSITERNKEKQIKAQVELEKVAAASVVNNTKLIHSITIRGDMPDLMRQLNRLVGKRVGIDTSYIHGASIDWLREAIDAKEKQEVKDE